MRGAWVLVLFGSALLVYGGATAASDARAARRSGFVASHCDYRSGAGCPSPPTSCHLRGELQDPGCTPGALNPAVRQSTIARTICATGYTTRIRPPTSYTEPLKFRLMRAYGEGSQSASAFELDHLISLELGGAPADPRNLWPESHGAPSYSYRKDGLENKLRRQVCSGAISLRGAQREIVNWAAHI